MSTLNRSLNFTAPTTFAENHNRKYFFVVCKSGSIDLEFGGGGGLIPLAAGNHYCPYVCPTSEVKITGSGTYVVHVAE